MVVFFSLSYLSTISFSNLQLKIDEFESNVNEIKDPFPPADFPGKSQSLHTVLLIIPFKFIGKNASINPLLFLLAR